MKDIQAMSEENEKPMEHVCAICGKPATRQHLPDLTCYCDEHALAAGMPESKIRPSNDRDHAAGRKTPT